VAATLLLAPSWFAVAEERPISEYQLKAVFLFNFTQFVDWPADTFSSADQPVVIGVLGDDPFGSYLDETVRGERVNNRSLLIRRYHSDKELGECQVLFISQSEAGRLDDILQRLNNRSVLTVSDSPGFGQRGGMVLFVMEDHHVRLRINADAAKAAHLTISSKLLRAADIVTTGRH
jgi:hypothetical protein